MNNTILGRRLAAMPVEVRGGYLLSSFPGSHAEIFAVNELLVARPGAQLGEISVYTVHTFRDGMSLTYFVACPHCNYLLQGVHYIT